MYYIGIDIAKRTHEVCIMDCNGNITGDSTFRISNTQAGIEKLKHKFEKIEIDPESCIIGMEATGHYWLVLYSWLANQGYCVKVINPIITDGYRRMQIRKVKNDKVDAEIIARLMQFGEYQETSIPDEKLLSLKELCRFRSTQVQNCGDLKRRIIALLDQVFPEYEKLFSNIFGMTSKAILKAYPTPEEIAKLSTAKLTHILERASQGRFSKEKAIEVRTTASCSIGIRYAAESFAFQIKLLMEQVEFIEQQIKLLEERITTYMNQLNSPIQTIPGIGPVYAAIIVSELGNISRFSNGKQIVSYAGLDASVKASGEFVGNCSHISKRGSPYLRKAIWGAAFCATQFDPTLSDYYRKLLAKGKHHFVAVGAVARKMCYIIFAILTENRPYEKRSSPA